MADSARGMLIQLGYDVDALEASTTRAVGVLDAGTGKMVSRATAACRQINAELGKISASSVRASLGEIATLQDHLVEATTAGEKAIAAALRAEIDVRERVARAAAFQLQTQLSLAKVSGNSAQVRELQEVLGLYEQIKRQQRVLGVTGTAGLRSAEGAVSALAQAEAMAKAREGGVNLGKAGRSVFDSARFATLEEGSARLRIFGSALEPLGPLGLVAAAGVLAVGEAFAKSHEAIEYADGLYKTAAAAHVSTDALQEMRAAVTKAGGDASQAGPALLQFSETLGKAQEGLARGQRGFLALGFDKSQIKGFSGTDEALDAVVAKIQNLSSRSQQDAAISQFGLQGLAPLILAGADAWTKYREEAKAAGLVLDQTVIERGHELNVQMDELSSKIKNELTTAFINLGPVLVQLLGYVDQMLARITQFTSKLTDLPAGRQLLSDLAKAPVSGVGGTVKIEKDIIDLVRQKAAVASGQTAFAHIGPETPEKPPTGTGRLKDLSPKGSDQTLSFDKSATDALNSGKEAVAKAQASLVEGIMAHAAAEKDAIDAGLRKKLADLEAEAQKIAAAKNDADKLAQRAKINSAKAAEQEAAEIDKRLVDQKAATAVMEQFLSYTRRIHADYNRIAENSAAMAETVAERNRIERDLLLKEQKEDLIAFDERTKDELSKLSGTELDSRRSQLGAERGAKVDRNTSDAARQAYNSAGPLDQYLRTQQDLDTTLQGDAVDGIRTLNQSLIEMAANSKDAGRILENWFMNLALKVAEQELEANTAPALAAGAKGLLAFLGLAGGGQVSGPGSSTSDSIPAMLSDGEYVVKASAAQKHLALLRAINSGHPLKFAQGGQVGGGGVQPNFPLLAAVARLEPQNVSVRTAAPSNSYYDLRGAWVDKDVWAEVNRISAGHADAAGADAVQQMVGIQRDQVLNG